MEIIKIRVDEIPANYLRSLPLHHSQKEVEKGEGYSIFEYYLRPTPDFISELAGMSPNSQLLEPQWIIEELKERT